MNGTLPDVRKRFGVSLRELARVVGCSPSAVLDKLRGDSGWWLEEAHLVTAHFQTLDPSLTMDELFGLEPLPPSPDLDQLGGEPVHAGNRREEVA